jgi:hypothetical protein
MKRFIIIVCFFCLLVPISGQQNNIKNGPDIVFNETIYDFSEIPENKPISHVFCFTNTGSAPLVIKYVSSSCGCTIPEWTKKPIEPNKQGSITAHFDPKGFGGSSFRKSITVYTNVKKKEKKRIILILKGQVYKSTK